MEPLILTDVVQCNNCGNDSHCNTKLNRTEQHYEVDGGEEYEIEVCRQCRCKACIA